MLEGKTKFGSAHLQASRNQMLIVHCYSRVTETNTIPVRPSRSQVFLWQVQNRTIDAPAVDQLAYNYATNENS